MIDNIQKEKLIRFIDPLIEDAEEQGAGDTQTALRDVLTNMMHYAYMEDLNFSEALIGASHVWVEETFTSFIPGDEVDVKDPPKNTCAWSNEFRGTIVKVAHERRMPDTGDIYSGYCTVKDQEDNHYDIPFQYLKPVED